MTLFAFFKHTSKGKDKMEGTRALKQHARLASAATGLNLCLDQIGPTVYAVRIIDEGKKKPLSPLLSAQDVRGWLYGFSMGFRQNKPPFFRCVEMVGAAIGVTLGDTLPAPQRLTTRRAVVQFLRFLTNLVEGESRGKQCEQK